MPDSTSPPVVTPAAPVQHRGYFQQAQLDDIALAETVLASRRTNAATLIELDITALYLDSLGEARLRASETGQAREDSKSSTETGSLYRPGRP